jgi:hypothetical protein
MLAIHVQFMHILMHSSMQDSYVHSHACNSYQSHAHSYTITMQDSYVHTHSKNASPMQDSYMSKNMRISTSSMQDSYVQEHAHSKPRQCRTHSCPQTCAFIYIHDAQFMHDRHTHNNYASCSSNMPSNPEGSYSCISYNLHAHLMPICTLKKMQSCLIHTTSFETLFFH